LGTIPSIPGVTQIQYEYKGLPNGPELRTFKISGYVDGDVFHAGLHLKMIGDVDGDKNLYTGEIPLAFVRLRLDTLSSVASFSERGEHRNGVRPWRGYQYSWRGEGRCQA
jgi:hypothetical protein